MQNQPHYLSLSGTGLVFVGSQQSNNLEALSLDSGLSMWRKNLDAPMWGEAVVLGTSLLVAPKDQALVALRPESGEALWWLRPRFPARQSLSQYSMANLNRAPLVGWEKSLLFLSLRGILSQLDAEGKVLAQLRVPRGDDFWARPVVCGDSFFAATRRGELLEIHLGDWKLLSFENFSPSHGNFPGGAEVLADLCSFGNRVLVATVDGTLYCRSSQGSTPQVCWSRPLGTGLETLNAQALPVFQPVCDEQGRVFVAYGRTLLCLNSEKGDEQWRYQSSAAFSSPPVVRGSQVFITDRRPALLSLSGETGQPTSIQALAAQACTSPLPSDQGVVVGLRNNSLVKLKF